MSTCALVVKKYLYGMFNTLHSEESAVISLVSSNHDDASTFLSYELHKQLRLLILFHFVV